MAQVHEFLIRTIKIWLCITVLTGMVGQHRKLLADQGLSKKFLGILFFEFSQLVAGWSSLPSAGTAASSNRYVIR
jgi:hypothetical protein